MFKFKFPWKAYATADEHERLQVLIGQEIEVEEETNESLIHYGRNLWLKCWKEYSGDIEKIYETFPHLTLEVTGVVTRTETEQSFIKAVDLMLQANKKAELLIAECNDLKNSFNAKCEVHVPGFGLLAIDDVRYENNCCSEYLQEKLEEGWRIIAVCPQPDQRRPDYILGRNKGAAFAYLDSQKK